MAIKHKIKISIAEMIANKECISELIEARLDDARESLKAEIALNFDIHIRRHIGQEQYRKSLK